MELLATYPNSQAALHAEQLLKAAGMVPELIPVPRQIHSDCGFCLLLGAADGVAVALRASGARELWRVCPADPSSERKVKCYERIP